MNPSALAGPQLVRSQSCLLGQLGGYRQQAFCRCKAKQWRMKYYDAFYFISIIQPTALPLKDDLGKWLITTPARSL